MFYFVSVSHLQESNNAIPGWADLSFVFGEIDQEGEGRQQHFVLIHGLGHGAWCWYKVVTLLKHKVYIVSSLDLTSNGINRVASTDQVKSIAHYAEPLLDYIINLGNDEKVLGFSGI